MKQEVNMRCVLMFCFLAPMMLFAQDLQMLANSGTAIEIKRALQFGAMVDAVDSLGRTALHKAAFANPHDESVEALLSAGADIHKVDRDGWEPVHHLAFGKATVTRAALLLKSGHK